MNFKKMALLSLAGALAFGLSACELSVTSDESSTGGNGGSGRISGDDNPPSTVGPNGVDYKNSRSYREYTADLTVGSVKYPVVRIGDQLWMGENLNDPTAGGVCYEDDEANCDRFGRLYTWAEAMALDTSYNYRDATLKIKNKHQGICPDGWRLPTEADFEKLLDFIRYDYDHDDIALDNGFNAGDDISGIQLKSTNFDAYDDMLWNTKEGVPGEDTYGFYGVGTGFGRTEWTTDDYGYDVVEFTFDDISNVTHFWTSTQLEDNQARTYNLYYRDAYMAQDWWQKDVLNTVRCMKDY